MTSNSESKTASTCTFTSSKSIFFTDAECELEPENLPVLTSAQNEMLTENDQLGLPFSKIDQKQLFELWRVYPSLRPPVNELYLTDISDNMLFNFGLPNSAL